jgi:adenylate kinase family enzyme
MAEIGRYIVVYGPACSGKSTVARRLATAIDVPCIELDAIFWMPDWVEKPLDEFRADVSAALSRHPDGWVLDGNYSRVRDLILPFADTVIWLSPPFRVAFWRLLKRTVARCIDHKPLWGTNYESWRQSFFSRDSLILYQVINWRRYNKKIRQDLENIPHQASVIQLCSSREVETFLRSLSDAAG